MNKKFCDKCDKKIQYDHEFIYYVSASLQSVAGGAPKSIDTLEICEKCWKKDLRKFFPTGQQSERYEAIVKKFESFSSPSNHAHEIPAINSNSNEN